MTKKRRKMEEENRKRMESHSREHARAVGIAAKQRQPVDGLRPVQLDSIADQLDETDPRIRGMVTKVSDQRGRRPAGPATPGSPAAFHQLQDTRTERDDPATEPIAAPYRSRNGEFVPPQFQPPFEVREKNTVMSSKEAIFSSNERVTPKSGNAPGGRGKTGPGRLRKFMRLRIPADVVEAIGITRLEAMDFEVEVLEDGILYRPAGTRPQPVMPTWAKGSLAK